MTLPAEVVQLASDAVLDEAYRWLCRQRLHHPPDADVWTFRWWWAREKKGIRRALSTGRYWFGRQTRVRLENGDRVDL